MQVDLDKFYTNPNMAKELIEELVLSKYDNIVEPSAGNGAFSRWIDGVIAYDIEPEHESIVKQDYLALNCKFKGNTLIIGNPPFGKRSSLAKLFIKKSIELNATTIAFVLPNTFSKAQNQGINLFPKEWKLVVERVLEDSAFILPNGEPYYVPCTFYVWSKIEDGEDKRKTKLEQPKEFKFMKRGDKTSDFTINGNSKKVKNLDEVSNPKAEHYIKVSDNNDVSLFKDIFSNLEYETHSSVNGGNYWIGQQEIISAYNKFKAKNDPQQ